MRKRIVTFASALAVATAVGLGAGTADAQTVQPASAQGCRGDVCMSLSDPSHGRVSVHAWAYNTTFYGFFDLRGPGGLHKTSSTKWYFRGGKGPTWHVPAVVGAYCVTGFHYLGPGAFEKIGGLCKSVE